jgi:hypothetical protein
MERLFTVLRGLIDAYDVLVVSLQGIGDFLFKRLNSHEAENKSEWLELEREKIGGVRAMRRIAGARPVPGRSA